MSLFYCRTTIACHPLLIQVATLHVLITTKKMNMKLMFQYMQTINTQLHRESKKTRHPTHVDNFAKN